MPWLLISDFQINCSPMLHLFLHICSILASQCICLKQSVCLSLIIQSQIILKIQPNQKKKKKSSTTLPKIQKTFLATFFLYHTLAGYIWNSFVLLYLSLHHLRSTVNYLRHPGVFFIAFHFSSCHQTPFISPGVFIAMFTWIRTEAGWEQNFKGRKE